jgi:crotonobetainyl-CoA:carnitine CoA-transferase CaiB-like acyl-CoA transferase
LTELSKEHSRKIPRLPFMDLGRGFNLLEGIKVLDLTTSIAGPYATMMLADLGAEIIKIERPGGGDDSRSWGPPFLDGESLWFLSVNRNKRSLTLDISSCDGRKVFEELVKKSDVIVLNQPPQTARKLGTDAETICALRPDIIYTSISGFGLDGPRSNWTCYDLIAEGYSGIMDLTGEPLNPPQKVGAPAADMLAGQDAAFATVAALFDRARSGKGRVIDISLVESMTRFLTSRIVPYLGTGQPVTRSGGKDSVIAIYQTFDTADDPMTLALGNDAIWARFWSAVGEPEVALRPEYMTNEKRGARRSEIVDRIQEILSKERRDHWLNLFANVRVPAGPINGVEDVAADQVLIERGLFYKVKDQEREIPQVGTGFRIDGKANRPSQPPPRLGSGTDQILKEFLGYSETQIEKLRDMGVV